MIAKDGMRKFGMVHVDVAKIEPESKNITNKLYYHKKGNFIVYYV